MEENKLQIFYKDITILKPAPWNPRKISDWELRKIINSIQEFGFVDPVIVDANDMILGGHQRVKAAESLGIQHVPVVVVPVEGDEAKALNIALNRLGGDFDEKKLAELLESMQEDKRYKSGMDDDEIAKLVGDMMHDDGTDDVPEPEIESRTKRGDKYILGDHLLVCGDSTRMEEVAVLMGDERAAMVFTDPPYNVDYKGGMTTDGANERRVIMNDKMSDEAFGLFLTNALTNALHYSDGCAYVCMGSSEIPNLRMAFNAAGGHYQATIIWVKNAFTLGRTDWQNQYEIILYGWPDRVVNHFFYGRRDQGNVWETKPTDAQLAEWAKTMITEESDVWRFDRPTVNKEHPTMKPLPLIMKAVEASSKYGQVVLDLFGGSGQTLLACEQTGRRCRMMELDPAYCDVIVKRWEEHTGKTAEHIPA